MKEGQPKNIQRKEYTVPSHLIETTELSFEINEDTTSVKSVLRMLSNPAANMGPEDRNLVLDGGEALETTSIKLDGRELLSNEYSIEGEKLTLFDMPESFELETNVLIKPQENTTLEGLYKSGGMFCTQCEAEGFRHITWYLDRPDVLSKFRTTVKANKKDYPILLSNGNDISRGEEGEQHWVTWEDPFNKPAYLFALVAGDLECVEDQYTTMSGRDVKLQIFSEAHNIDKVGHGMNSLKNSMKWDEEVYGREYDLDIFMIVAVESFNMGAMENKGLNIFNTSCVLARPDTTTDAGYQRVEAVVGHEYFHNWSGNRVTCRDWFQLSLKEGFTVLRDQQFSAAMGSETVCRVDDVATLRAAQFPEDAGPMAHPIRPDSYIEINNFYTATVYEKGAEVVRMIRTLLGPENFRKGSDLYFDRHDGQAVTTEDFVVAMEDANDIKLEQFRLWYSQAGTPTVKASAEFDAAAQTYTLTLEQSCPPTPGQKDKQPFHMPVTVGLLSTSGSDQTLSIDKADVANRISVGPDGQSVVLSLTEPKQTFVFTDVSEAPIPSILRGFSAPVKLEYNYSRDDLMFLMSNDSDGFNRWEAGQRLGIDVIQEMIVEIQRDPKGKISGVDQRLVDACASVMDQAIAAAGDSKFDRAMIAVMLVLPSESYLAELQQVVDVDAVHQARERVRLEIATQLRPRLQSIYDLCEGSDSYEATGSEIGRRDLRNVALSYLMLPGDAESVELCRQQFDAAVCMSDTSAAIRALINSASSEATLAKTELLTKFYDRWQDEALVVDLWFSIQAACPLAGTLAKVKELMSHPAFTLSNPNRLRSLIGVFAGQNNVNFHHEDGSGYEFLASQIIEVDATNPQIAARILGPLTRWGRYDANRQALMKAQLSRILETENLSNNVFEIASKSL
jgi:aminopeptidase N